MGFFSCASTTITTNDEWHAELYFKRAQDSANIENYKLALAYYQHILDTFSDDVDKIAMAHYEIGVLHFRLKDYQLASDYMTLVEEAMARNVALPDWLPVLTVMMRGNIDAKLNEDAVKIAAKEAKELEKAQKKARSEAVKLAREAAKNPPIAAVPPPMPNEPTVTTTEEPFRESDVAGLE